MRAGRPLTLTALLDDMFSPPEPACDHVIGLDEQWGYLIHQSASDRHRPTRRFNYCLNCGESLSTAGEG